MPNPTFFHLPEEKQQRILDAIWQEFTEHSYMDASINRIIQTAEISRGSFYQYFFGKKDVFSYLLQTILDTIKEVFSAQLMVHGNDLFAAILGMYELILWKRIRGRRDLTMDRVQFLLQRNAELDLTQFTDQLDRKVMEKNMGELLDRTGYRLESALERQALVHMLVSISLSTLADTMRHPQKEDQNHQLLETQLELVRRSLERMA